MLYGVRSALVSFILLVSFGCGASSSVAPVSCAFSVQQLTNTLMPQSYFLMYLAVVIIIIVAMWMQSLRTVGL